MKNRLLGAFALCAAVFVANEAEAKTWEIPAPDGVGDVVALTNALKCVEKDDIVQLGKGTYALTGIEMAAGSHLKPAKKCTILGDPSVTREEIVLLGGGSVDSCRVIDLSSNGGTMTNLTITGGYTTSNAGAVKGNGSGTWLRNCILTNNQAGVTANDHAGACASANLDGCYLAYNSAGRWGGAAQMDGCVAYNSTFEKNTSGQQGGAIVRAGVITNCTFIGNWAKSGGGGAIHALGSGRITGCRFFDNKCTGSGGAICSYSSGSPDFVTNCVFRHNSSTTGGLATYQSYTSGCTFLCHTGSVATVSKGEHVSDSYVSNRNTANNVAVFTGATRYANCLFQDNAGNANALSVIVDAGVLHNCTFVGNMLFNNPSYVVGPFGKNVVAVNTIVTGTYPYDFKGGTGDVHVLTNCFYGTTYNSNAEGPSFVGCKKIADFKFVDPANGDYTLQRKSPAMDAGYQDDDYLAAIGPVDLAGNARVFSGKPSKPAVIDIGCYECQIFAPGLMLLVR